MALVVDLAIWRGGEAGSPLEAAVIAAILVLNATLGFWQERKAERAIEALNVLSTPEVWALRDGRLVRVTSTALVPGDRIRLDAGDRVPADTTVASGDNLLLDEAVLTGESVPVPKQPGEELLSGTLIVRGRAWADVLRTGPSSAMGRVAGLLRDIQRVPTPLERRMARFGRAVAAAVVLLAALLVIAGLLSEGTAGFTGYFLLAVALAVAAVPEGLPAAVTFALALGVERMARRNAVVRRLDAVEALGSVTVIATDKTGTLTENRMEVRSAEAVDPVRLLRAMVLASDADPETGAGDPLEAALLEHVRKEGVDPAWMALESPRLSSRAFDSATGFMRVTVMERGASVSYVKGAPEVLATRCRLPAAERETWLHRAAKAGAEGLRPIAFAWGEDEQEAGLAWLGLALLWDPPRAEAGDAVTRCLAAGIRVLMVTGDHPETARSIAATVGIPKGEMLTGADLDELSPKELRDAVRRTAVFARVTPEHKLRVVEALQAAGEVVAVTGDGVNDAPALKRADVGVAMGRRGSAVSREVADLVLLDDHFATIVAAVEEGRSIFANIRKFLRFLFSTNLSEVIVVAGGFATALVFDLHAEGGTLLLPLTAAQLLWINLVTDGAPALALALDRNPAAMARPPRPRDEPLLDRPTAGFIVVAGSAKAFLGAVLLFALPSIGEAPDAVRTAVFFFMAAGQVLFVYASRRTDGALPPNRTLHLAVITTLMLQPMVVLSPFFRKFLGTSAMSLSAWAMALTAILVAWAVAEASGRRFRS